MVLIFFRRLNSRTIYNVYSIGKMIGLIAGTVDYIFRKPERRFILLGLDNAGKTTILEQLKFNYGQKKLDLSKIQPTIGFNVGQMEIQGTNAIFWDLGGHRNFRMI